MATASRTAAKAPRLSATIKSHNAQNAPKTPSRAQVSSVSQAVSFSITSSALVYHEHTDFHVLRAPRMVPWIPANVNSRSVSVRRPRLISIANRERLLSSHLKNAR